MLHGVASVTSSVVLCHGVGCGAPKKYINGRKQRNQYKTTKHSKKSIMTPEQRPQTVSFGVSIVYRYRYRYRCAKAL